MQEKTRKIKSFIAGMLSFYLGGGLLFSGFNFYSLLTSSNSGFSVPQINPLTFYPICGAIILFLILINIGNNWKSWAIGILGAFVVNSASVFVFFFACLILISFNQFGDFLIPLLYIIPLFMMGVAIWLYYKIISKDEENKQKSLAKGPKMNIWAD